MKQKFRPGAVLKASRWVLVPLSVAWLVTACGGDDQDVPPPIPVPVPVIEPVVRKNIKALTPQERADFVEAILRLRQLPAPDSPEASNWYDQFVASHLRKLVCEKSDPAQGGYGHNGPDILTWHRAFLLEFEAAMSQAMGKPMAIPYWDWTDPSSTPVVFADDFMGGKGDPAQGYVVTSGPFRMGAWAINVKGPLSSNPGQFDWLVRAVGNMLGMTALPDPQEIQQALLRPQYDVAPWGVTSDLDRSFRAFVDGSIGATGTSCNGGVIAIDGATAALLHGTVHMWAGGTDDAGNPGGLTDTATSPNDPIFWLHHANVDRLAESWWGHHGYQYLPISGGPRGSNLNDVMWPYSQTNGDMVVRTETLGYTYDELIKPDGRTAFLPAADWVEQRAERVPADPATPATPATPHQHR